MKKKSIKIITYSFLAIFFSTALSGCTAVQAGPNVKKSDTGICHEKGTNYYKNTKSFESFTTIEDCLNSGGRLPKK